MSHIRLSEKVETGTVLCVSFPLWARFPVPVVATFLLSKDPSPPPSYKNKNLGQLSPSTLIFDPFMAHNFEKSYCGTMAAHSTLVRLGRLVSTTPPSLPEQYYLDYRSGPGSSRPTSMTVLPYLCCSVFVLLSLPYLAGLFLSTFCSDLQRSLEV